MGKALDKKSCVDVFVRVEAEERDQCASITSTSFLFFSQVHVSYFIRGLAADRSASSKSKMQRDIVVAAFVFLLENENVEFAVKRYRTWIVRAGVHLLLLLLLLSESTGRVTVRFEFVGGIFMGTVRIETLPVLEKEKAMSDERIRAERNSYEFEHIPVEDIIVSKALSMEQISK